MSPTLPPDQTILSVVGWGQTKKGKYRPSQFLRRAMGTTRSNGKCYDLQGGNPDGKEGERIICLDAIFSGERPCRVRSRLVRVVWGLNDVEKIRREVLQLYIRLQYQPDLRFIRTRAREKNLFTY